jgi:hypothetical protein
MYKEIKIVYCDSARDEIIKIFEKLDIDKYMNLNGLEAVWAKNVKHLNTRIWPGTDSLMFLILENEKANVLLEELREMKKTLMDGVGFFVLVSPIEEII